MTSFSSFRRLVSSRQKSRASLREAPGLNLMKTLQCRVLSYKTLAANMLKLTFQPCWTRPGILPGCDIRSWRFSVHHRARYRLFEKSSLIFRKRHAQSGFFKRTFISCPLSFCQDVTIVTLILHAAAVSSHRFLARYPSKVGRCNMNNDALEKYRIT